MPVWWCLIPWEPPGAVSGAPGLSQQMALCPWGCAGISGVSFSCWVLFSPAALWVVLQNLPLQVPIAWLLCWAQHPAPPQAMHGCWCCGVEHGCCLLGCFGDAPPARHWDLCLCVSSLTLLPPLSVLFCLHGADALLLGGLLSSFQAFGFGVYCLSFLPALHKQMQPLAASPMPALRMC